jgi:ComF family protein
MMVIGKLADQLFSPIIDFIYPPICISCNKTLLDKNQKVCIDCWDAIPIITKEHPLYMEMHSRLLGEGNINHLVSPFIFESEGPFQHIAHALKYREFKSLGIELGRRIGTLIKDWNIEADIIIPVPLHRIKHRERGYNQSEFIAYGIASVISKPIDSDTIFRTRYTQTQTKLNHEQRKANLRDVFEVHPEARKKLKGKKCLLVDDIITTGATTNECAKELLKAGAGSIIAASAAIAK